MGLIPVTKKFNVSVTNNPSAPFTEYVDLCGDASQTLSDFYGKNIRQGHHFKLVKIDVGLEPIESGYDSGLSVSAQIVCTPSTKHTRKAWNLMFKEWKAQKNLAGAVGAQVRYDDMEFAYDDTHAATTFASRRSAVRATGIGDPTEEVLVMKGISVAGQYLSLEQYYNERFPILPESTSSFGVPFKEPKFDHYWPENVELQAQANLSVIATEIQLLPPGGVVLSGSSASQTPWEGDLDVFLGLFKIYVYVIPDDTVMQIEDSAEVTFTFWIKKWTPLVWRKKSRRFRRKSRYYPKKRRYSRRSYGRRKRWKR